MNKVKIAGFHYDQLRAHLFPGDNKEAVAVALCGRSLHKGNHSLLVKELFLIPYDHCFVRETDNVQWPTELIYPMIQKAAQHGWAVLKIHCHPGGYDKFSEKDDRSDNELFRTIHDWIEGELPHASCIMLPDGRILGRLFFNDIQPVEISHISIAGSDIHNWYYGEYYMHEDEAQQRNLQAFGKKTVTMLNRLKIGVVGCSGTGSPTIEQLKRLSVGELVLVDNDIMDLVNVNRIIGSTRQDAIAKTLKVDIMKREIEAAGFNTRVTTFSSLISDHNVIKELADCDILFSCVDSAEGRHVLNQISSYYLIPLFDMGVKLQSDGKGGIDSIDGVVHVVLPGGSSLMSRNQYTLERVASESQKRLDKEEYERNRYLLKAGESSPAVISVNMQAAATAVNEFLARIHPFRNFDNRDCDAVRIMFAECLMYRDQFPEQCPYFSKKIGLGDVEPLLNSIEFSRNEKAA